MNEKFKMVCPILFKEKLTIKQVICFIMSTMGLVLVIGVGGLEGNGTNLIGIGFGLSAAVLYATVILHCMYFSALEQLKGQEAAILGYIDPLVAIIVSVSLLGENIDLTQIRLAIKSK